MSPHALGLLDSSIPGSSEGMGELGRPSSSGGVTCRSTPDAVRRSAAMHIAAVMACTAHGHAPLRHATALAMSCACPHWACSCLTAACTSGGHRPAPSPFASGSAGHSRADSDSSYGAGSQLQRAGSDPLDGRDHHRVVSTTPKHGDHHRRKHHHPHLAAAAKLLRPSLGRKEKDHSRDFSGSERAKQD